MRFLILFSFFFIISNGCFQVRKFNECGCFDYKPLTRSNIARLDPEWHQEISNGNLTFPSFVYENCSYIHIECDPNSGEKRTLLRTNWPEGQLIYAIDMNKRSRTSTLLFDVKCDKKTHEWKYTSVEDDREIVTESIICYSI